WNIRQVYLQQNTIAESVSKLAFSFNITRPKVKPQVESQTNRTFHIFKAVQYKSQVVAGTNYFIKVHVGGVEYIHLRIFRSLPVHGNELKVHGVQSPKGEQDEIDYF
uniref:Cystatin-B n=1 Tax=Erpetoichthys calabaricus TaxID=27687 RepID=A0A8C4RWJ6_ERPCA